MKRLFAFALSVSVLSASAATVDRLVARQMWPWERHFEIGYRLKTAGGEAVDVSLRVSAGGESFDIPAEKLIGETKSLTSGDYKLVWDSSLCESPTADWLKSHTGELAFSVVMEDSADVPEYLIIDLSGGAEAASWPSERVVGKPLTGWTDEHKTTKLVLRRIYAGGRGNTFSSATGVSFMFGCPAGDAYKTSGYDFDAAEATLTNDYYIGVFELTQKQYQLITGQTVAQGQNAFGNSPMRPQANIGYYAHMRGTEAGLLWPVSSDVDGTSLMGILRSKVVLPPEIPSAWKFDLPTEAQWEFACRAGTTTPWNNGGNYDVYVFGQDKSGNDLESDHNLDLIGWNPANAPTSGSDVGRLPANAWGLYDMHGNAAEYCLDYNYAGTLGEKYRKGFEPMGYTTTDSAKFAASTARVVKGGGYSSYWTTKTNFKYFRGHRACSHVQTYSGDAASYTGCRIVLRNSAVNAGH